MINDGLSIGGTCVNVGGVPSKALIRAAESHHLPSLKRFDGIESERRLVDVELRCDMTHRSRIGT